MPDLRKVAKTKTIFPTDDRLPKLLYLAIIDPTEKWTGLHRNTPKPLLSQRTY